MRVFNYISICLILAFTPLLVLSQDTLRVESIQVMGHITDGKVLIRWAPSNSVSWQKGNLYGYSLYRKTVIRNGIILDKPDSLFLGQFRPMSLDKWKPYADSSTFAIAAEAIYGKNFDVLVTDKTSFLDIVNVAREQQNRYSLGLLCADRSFTVAQYMGLAAIDSDVNANEAYLYLVKANYSDTLGRFDVGYTLVDFRQGNFLPRPFGFTIDEHDGRVSILMPYDPFQGIYSTFELQRSDYGGEFKSVTGKGYYSLSTTDDASRYFTFVDSVPRQAASYRYRIRGITPFETLSPFSDTLEVNVMPSLRVTPIITSIKEVNGNVLLSWDFDSLGNENISGFMVFSSTSPRGNLTPVTTEPIGRELRFTGFTAPADFAYYRVGAIDSYGRKYLSEPVLFQTVDSLPPLPPFGLVGHFDSTGVVTLMWRRPPEPDVLGYGVQYAATVGAEFTQISNGVVNDTLFTQQFPLSSLSTELLFRVVAYDTRYNPSSPSETITLLKPDTLPPSPPFISLVTDSTANAAVKVFPSRSKDVLKHKLFIQEDSGLNQLLFDGVLKNDTVFIISKETQGNIYCISIDNLERTSKSNIVRVYDINHIGKQINTLVSCSVNLDEATIDLFWDKIISNGNILIYRKNDMDNFRLISTVKASEHKFSDKIDNIFQNYYYKLVFEDTNGNFSNLNLNVKLNR